MKKFRWLVWVFIAMLLILIGYEAFKNRADSFADETENSRIKIVTGWMLKTEHSKERPVTLPHIEKGEQGDVLEFSNHLPEDSAGKTLLVEFTGNNLEVYADGELIYGVSFEQQKLSGSAGNSASVLVDIPEQPENDEIIIRITVGAERLGQLKTVTVSEKQSAVIGVFRGNLLYIIIAIFLLILSIMFISLGLIQRVSQKDSQGLVYLTLFCFNGCLAFAFSANVLNLFYDNIVLYDAVSLFANMMMPFLLILYYERVLPKKYGKVYNIMAWVAVVSFVVRLFQQHFKAMRVVNLSYLSWLLLLTVAALSCVCFIRSTGRKLEDTRIQKLPRNAVTEQMVMDFAALLALLLGIFADAVFSLILRKGTQGKIAMYAMAFYCLAMMGRHISGVARGYSATVKENTLLMQREIETMEVQNRELQIARDEAESAKAEAVAANAAKGRFLANMSHEIRTPINAVLGMDEMILRETHESSTRDYANDIYSAGHTLLSLVNDILDFSKIESGKMEILPVEYDLSSMIHDLVVMISAKASAKDLKLLVSVDEKLPSRLLGDDVRLRQILTNILNNAVKYTPEGSVSLHISEAERTDGKIKLLCKVEDTGIGIREEDLGKLFVEFERIEESRNRNIEGTGLGMNITAQLLGLMGSRLEVSSVYGKGSVFYFVLEQTIIDDTPMGDFEKRIENTEHYTYEAGFIAPDAEILVVDDNAINRKVFMNLLKQTQIRIDEAAGGQEALDLTEQKHYDLIFLDHMMPDMDGIETLRRMKERQDGPCVGTPVIILTANAVAGAKEEYLSKGFDGYLSKPIISVKLEQLLATMLPDELLKEAPDEPEKEEGTTDGQRVREEEQRQIDELPEVDGVDWHYAWIHSPGRNLLEYTVKVFYKGIESEALALQELYERLDTEEGLSGYRIKVHAMKSEAALIGSFYLAGLAKVLEYAARDGERETITCLHDRFLTEWRAYREKLTGVFGLGEEEPNRKWNTEEACDLLEAVLNGLETMDVDTADGAMDSFQHMSVPEELKDPVQKLAGAVHDLDADSAKVAVEQIMKQIGI